MAQPQPLTCGSFTCLGHFIIGRGRDACPSVSFNGEMGVSRVVVSLRFLVFWQPFLRVFLTVCADYLVKSSIF